MTTDDRVEPVNSVLTSEQVKPRLLLIEDDWRTHSALRKILGRLGWDVLSAMTVSSGLALLTTKPEVVLLDLMLPDGDGATVLRQIRSQSLETKIIVTTGVDDRQRLAEVLSLQPHAVLRKPLELADLLRLLTIDPGS